MTDRERRMAVLQAAICRAHIRAMGMQADNMGRIRRGEALAYDEQAFLALIDEEGIDREAIQNWIASVQEEPTP